MLDKIKEDIRKERESLFVKYLIDGNSFPLSKKMAKMTDKHYRIFININKELVCAVKDLRNHNKYSFHQGTPSHGVILEKHKKPIILGKRDDVARIERKTVIHVDDSTDESVLLPIGTNAIYS